MSEKYKPNVEDLTGSYHYHANMIRSLNVTITRLLHNLQLRKEPYETNIEYIRLDGELKRHEEEAEKLSAQIKKIKDKERIDPVLENEIALTSIMREIKAHLDTFTKTQYHKLPKFFEHLDFLLAKGTAHSGRLKQANYASDLTEKYDSVNQFSMKNRSKIIDVSSPLSYMGEFKSL